MSRIVLTILSLCLLKNVAEASATITNLNKFLNYQKSNISEIDANLSKNPSKLNVTLSFLRERLQNVTRENNDVKNATSTRNGKLLFPNIELRAGVNFGDIPRANMAKIVESVNPSVTRIFSPYIAALYNPVSYSSPSHTTENPIAEIMRLLQLIDTKLKNTENIRNTHAVQVEDVATKLLNDYNSEVNIIDSRQRLKDRKRKPIKKQQKYEPIEDDIDDEPRRRKPTKKQQKYEPTEDDRDDEMDPEDVYPTPRPRQKPTMRPSFRQSSNDTTTTTTTAAPTTITTAPTTTTTAAPMNVANDTTGINASQRPGYYGGYPQSIGHIGITSDIFQDSYGPPFYNPDSPIAGYPSPVHSYGAPQHSYNPQTSNHHSPQYYNPQPSNNYSPQSYNPPTSSYNYPPTSNGGNSHSYGPPQPSYGVPSQTYPSTTQVSPLPAYIPVPQIPGPITSYGTPLYNYGPAYPYHQEPIHYETQSDAALTGWPHDLPSGRSRNFQVGAHATRSNMDGFVPI